MIQVGDLARSRFLPRNHSSPASSLRLRRHQSRMKRWDPTRDHGEDSSGCRGLRGQPETDDVPLPSTIRGDAMTAQPSRVERTIAGGPADSDGVPNKLSRRPLKIALEA